MKLKLHTKIIIGLILGVVLGLLLGEKAKVIEPVGTIFLRLITMIVVPLVLVSLMLGTASLGDLRKLGRIGFKTIAYFMVTTVIAIIIGLGLANIIKPGAGLNETVKAQLYSDYQDKADISIQRLEDKPSAVEILVGIIPTNPIKALIDGNMLQIIFLALLFGTVLTMIKKERADPLIKLLEGVNDAVIQVVPVTRLPDRSLRPYEARIESGTSGLGKPSRTVANQIRTVARHRIVKRIGRLTGRELEAVDRALEIQLGLRREP